jgi:pimeloyl-ACP methyl ester carboxylesterase
MPRDEEKPSAGALKAAGALGLAGAAGWLGYSAVMTPHNVNLPPAIDAERRELQGRAGRLSYYVAGEGPPVLLVHSINAAGSAYEVRTVFEHLQPRRRVYAVDLPGFGFSDRSARRYEIRLYVDAILDMLDLIADETRAPIDAVAVSLASEFVARAAVERPEAFATLALVTPTGFSKWYGVLRDDTAEKSREIPGMHAAFAFPLWSQGVYDLLVTRASIRYFLQRTNGSKYYDEGMLDYDYLTTHVPGAKNAPLAFLAARLFSADIRSVYERLTLPIWVPHATRGDFKDFSASGWAKARPNWRFQPFDAGALPHFERREEFMAAYDGFLRDAATRTQPRPVHSTSTVTP